MILQSGPAWISFLRYSGAVHVNFCIIAAELLIPRKHRAEFLVALYVVQHTVQYVEAMR